MSEAQELFYELFVGAQGGWLGFLIVASIMLLVTVKIKYAGIMFSVTSVMIGIMMSQELASNNNLMWCMIMYFSMPFFLIMIMYKSHSL